MAKTSKVFDRDVLDYVEEVYVKMWIKDIGDFLMKSSICEICILRYTNADFHAIEHSLKAYDVTQNENVNKKRSKPNICFACLGVFQENIADEIVQNSNLSIYECDSIYSSISVPITILIHELIIWIELMHKFPEYISSGMLECEYLC